MYSTVPESEASTPIRLQVEATGGISEVQRAPAADMRLGIISDGWHYYDAAGVLYNHHPVLARQFECWAMLFERVYICAPLLEGKPPRSAVTYDAPNIELLPIPPAGGNTIRAKLHLASRLPEWWRTIWLLLGQVDAVHIRCPGNISIVGLLALAFFDHPREAVYTGCWSGNASLVHSASYRAQRWFLRKYFRGPVAVYGTWPDQPRHIIPTFSPSYTSRDWEYEEDQVERRIERLLPLGSLQEPIRLVSIGSLNQLKNHQLVIQSIDHARRLGISCRLDILGEGVLRGQLQHLIHKLQLENEVVLYGQVADDEVREFYRRADFVVQAPLAEGFGKVPHEAFFFGAIPIISDVNLGRQIVGDMERGRCFAVEDARAIAEHVATLAGDTQEMIRLIRNGREFARSLTLEAWQEHIRKILEERWGIHLRAMSRCHRRSAS